MEALRVIATLATAYSRRDPWSPALEGILAYWQLRATLGEEAFALGSTGMGEPIVCDDLPLGREAWQGDWWWQASSPVVTAVAVFDRSIHRRFDDEAAYVYLDPAKRRIETAAGPYKNYRVRSPAVLAPCLEWHVIGEAAAIERLLARCDALGAGRGHGWGRVTGWQVTAEDADAERARCDRPLPEGFALAHGVSGPVQRWGIRPPGRWPAHQRACVMPVRS